MPVIAQSTWGLVSLSVRVENGSTGSSPGWRAKAAEVDRAAVEPRRRAGLEPREGEARAGQALRQAHRGRVTDPTGRPALQPDVDLAAQERPRGQHDRAGGPGLAVGRDHASDAAGSIEVQIVDRKSPNG